MSKNNALWVEKDSSEAGKIFVVGRGFFEKEKERAFFLEVKQACEVKLKSSFLWVTQNVLGKVRKMIASTVVTGICVARTTDMIQVIHVVKYDLIEMETVLVI